MSEQNDTRVNNIVDSIAGIVVVVAVLVLVGWILGVTALTSILPSLVTMKFSTAFVFLLAGIMLLLTQRARPSSITGYHIVVAVISLFIFLVMTLLLVSSLFGFETGIEALGVEEVTAESLSLAPGLPSVGTMASFILAAILGLLLSFHPFKRVSRTTNIFLSAVLTVIGVIALLGYAFSAPALFYLWPGVSGAMALHTAVLFVLLGVGFFLISRSSNTESV